MKIEQDRIMEAKIEGENCEIASRTTNDDEMEESW